MVKSDGTLGVDEGRFPMEMLQVLVKGGKEALNVTIEKATPGKIGKGDDEKEFKAGSSIANEANANNANDTTTNDNTEIETLKASSVRRKN